MSINKKNLIWIDLEMTGLNPDIHRIIQIATLITNSNLQILAEGPILEIYQSKKILNLMDNWNLRTHTSNGLIKLVKSSVINEKEAEKQTINFISQWVPENQSPICGNSIGQDRRFLLRYMPILEKYFNYRNLDVSTLKVLACFWKPNILKGLRKKNSHKAIEDIRESVKELNYYKKYFILK